MHYRVVTLLFLFLFRPLSALATDALPSYSMHEEVTASYTSVGSDTLAYLMSFWIVEFKRWHPAAHGQIEAAGSATAPLALMEDRAQFGPMSREMNARERKAFFEKFGYEPTRYRVAQDALAIYTPRENPIQGLALPQVDAIFSVESRCGFGGTVGAWGALGLRGELGAQAIMLFGRNLLSGTRAFFAEHALCGGRYKPSLKMQPSSADVVQRVASAANAIGYSGIGYKNPRVRAVPLARRIGEPFVEPTEENVRNGRYPLARFLYIYVNKPPGQRLTPLQREFLSMVLSERGQRWVANDGFIPLDRATILEERARLD